MTNRVMRVSAQLSAGQRALLLRHFNPKHVNVWCRQLTWAYRVSDEARFPVGNLELTIDGLHEGPGHECLTGSLHGGGLLHERFRPDGRPVHITLSTADGIPPAEASRINLAAIRKVDPVKLTLQLRRGPATQLTPERLAA